jgi:hypothetical protein
VWLAGCVQILGVDEEFVVGSSTTTTPDAGLGGSGGVVNPGGTGGTGATSGGGGGGGASCSAEICNGIDDDCNSVTDEGCPTDVTVGNGAFGAHTLFGSTTGGTAWEDVCPAGTALYRFTGRVGDALDLIQGHCAPLTLETDTSSSPYVYRIARGEGTVLGLNGGVGGEVFDAPCPADMFAVGISGEADSLMRDLSIHCAEIQITGGPGSFGLTYGPTTVVDVDAAMSGTAFDDLLASPAVVDRIRGRAGAVVDAVGIGEASVALVF